MKSIKFLHIIIFTVYLAAFACMPGCSKMDDSYKQFLDYGQQKYPGRPVVGGVLPGYKRMLLVWQNSSDPKVKKAKIYWNNRSDSMEVNIDPSQQYSVIPFDDLPEGMYIFEIYTFDDEGNRSVKTEIIGRVYGDFYQSTLLSRPIYDATVVNDSLRISWGGISDTAIQGTEVMYTDKFNKTQRYFVGKDILVSQLPDFPRGNIQYRTIYLPSPFALDTFYTPWVNAYIKGERFELPKTGWTATASSYDNRNGRTDRLPEKAIDGNISTTWVNLVGTTKYPHTITIDMGTVRSGIEGLSFYLNQTKEAPKTIRVLISNDNANWTQIMTHMFQYIAGYQYMDFPTTQSFRYFRIIAEEGALSTEPNIILPEVGVYIR